MKKTTKRIIVLLSAAVAMAFVGGCDEDPTKKAGPGGLRDQPYKPANGQYN